MIGILFSQAVALLMALIIMGGALLLGRGVARLIGLSTPSGLFDQLINLGLGVGLLVYLLLALGLSGLFTPFSGWILFLALLSILLLALRNWLSTRSNLTALRSVIPQWFRSLTGFERVLALAFAGLAAISVAGGFVPVHSVDALKYHFAAPQWYVNEGAIRFLPFFFFQLPVGGEMLNAWGLLLGIEALAPLLNSGLGLATALVLYAGGRLFAPRPAALAAAVLYFTLPGAWDYSYASMPDLALFFYLALAVLVFWRWRAERRPVDLLLAGCFIGLAAAFKIIGLYALFALALLVIWSAWRTRSERRWWTAPLTFGLGAAITGLPWYLRNWIVADNPIWPILYPQLGGRCWNMAAYESGAENIFSGYSLLGRSALDFLTGWPQLLTGLTAIPLFHPPGLGPLFLALLPVALLVGALRRRYGWLIVFALLYYVVWFPFSQYGRFYLPVYVVLYLPVAGAIHYLRSSGHPVRLVTTLAVVGWILFSGSWLAYRTLTYLPVMIGWESRSDFLRRATPFYTEIAWMNDNLPQEAVVLSDSPFLYYLVQPYVWSRQDLQGFIDYSLIQNEEDMRDALAGLGITHAFVFRCLDGEPCSEDPAPWQIILRNLLANDGEIVYENPNATFPYSITHNELGTVPVDIYRLALSASGPSAAICTDALP